MTTQRDRIQFLFVVPLLVAAACSDPITPGITISSADPIAGLRGHVASRDGDVLAFESKVTDGVLHATITDRASNVVAAYTEDGVARPDLVINDIPYTMTGEPGFDGALTELADHGDAIRTLAYDLVVVAPSGDLVRERRGLEVPFQAAQRPIGVAAERAGDGSDYYANEQMFAVKTLDRRLILQQNWMDKERARLAGDDQGDNCATGGAGALGSKPDDDSRVGDCFGRCGGGCGSWNHYVTNIHSDYLYSYDIENGGWCNVYSSTADYVHRTCGCAAHGCADHDYCVRTFCPDDAACAFCWPEAIWAGITWGSCLFQADKCWSYADPVAYPEDTRCFYCGPCGCAEGGPPSCDY
jgi:hypothetical protein